MIDQKRKNKLNFTGEDIPLEVGKLCQEYLDDFNSKVSDDMCGLFLTHSHATVSTLVPLKWIWNFPLILFTILLEPQYSVELIFIYY